MKKECGLSEEICACGCGHFISERSARRKAEGLSEGYVHGHNWKGKFLSAKTKRKMSLNHADVTGDKNPNYGKGLHGSANPNWQGGKVKRFYRGGNQIGVNRKKDLQFRREIKLRDGACVLCGMEENLTVHHITPWCESEDLRFNSLNCVTLCRSCHYRADNCHHRIQLEPVLLNYVARFKTGGQN